MSAVLLEKIRRAARKDPRYIARRLAQEALAEAERWRAPRRIRRTNTVGLARAAGHPDVDTWWRALAARPFLGGHPVSLRALEAVSPGAPDRVFTDAERALRNEIDLLGSGPVSLGTTIDWHCDPKTGHRWPPRFHRDIDYVNLDRPSDVKLPWEISRLQWALPLGQAYLLSGDERYAAHARSLLEQWIEANPCGESVNWACTMEPALRILSWTWLFHAFAGAKAWQDGAWRSRFLKALYLHGDFVARNLERADINGNHYTADAAGLVFCGLFFGDLAAAQRWQAVGWSILTSELPLQVHPDGVDFEASVPYHRLVLELFLLPALYRRRLGQPVASDYVERLARMGEFVAAYSRADGECPLWGDADDGRALPMGGQPLNDHRYLLGLLVGGLGIESLRPHVAGNREECAWLLGPTAAMALPDRQQDDAHHSRAFPHGGFYVLRHAGHHVFVDCGPLGLAGRGGHGHNDLLSFEAALHGVPLITDCGAYLYTASMEERNRFRSTAVHNTPQIDGEEINRFVRPDYLWTLHDDARHVVEHLDLGPALDVLEVSHDGYRRLANPVKVVRRFELDKQTGTLRIGDRFEGAGDHRVEVPLHFHPDLEVGPVANGRLELARGALRFAVEWDPLVWNGETVPARVSHAYGRVRPTTALRLRRAGPLRPLDLLIQRVPG